MQKGITIKEIAKQAGVSIGTVDRVLHNRGEVATSTRDRVEKIARDGNYSANLIARGLKLSKRYNIAVLLPEDNEYWQQLNKGLSNEAQTLAGIGIHITSFAFDRHKRNSFQEQAGAMLQSVPDGVIMAPLLEAEATNIAKELEKLKLPYILVDSNLTTSNALSFIGQDSIQSGQLAAKLLTLGYPQGYPVYVILIKDYDSLNKTINERISGLKKYYYDNGFSDSVIHEIELDDSFDSLNKIAISLASKDEPMHIFIPNSRAYAIIDALQSIDGNYRILGYDRVKANENYLRKGRLDFLIDQNPAQQGALAIQAFYSNFILKSRIPSKQLMPLEILTKENMDYSL